MSAIRTTNASDHFGIGRSLTAHHAVLISNVIGTESYLPEEVHELDEDAPLLLQNMWRNWENLQDGTDARALIEIYNDTQSDLAEVHSQFATGVLNLEQRAWAEQLSLRIYFELSRKMSTKNRFHRPILDELSERLADKFFVNFSLFQSLPDAWVLIRCSLFCHFLVWARRKSVVQ